MYKSQIQTIISRSLVSTAILIGGLGFTALALYIKGDSTRTIEYNRISNSISDFDGLPGTSSADWTIVYDRVWKRRFLEGRDNPLNDLKLEDLRMIDAYMSGTKSGR